MGDVFEDLLSELDLARLPSGRHGLPRSFVERNQRLRIAIALLRVLPGRGYAAATIGDITAEASVSRAAFYRHYSDKEDCFLATFDLCSDWFCERVEAAVAEAPDWRERIRAGVVEALALLGANPVVAHLIAIEGAQAGRMGRERRDALLERFAACLRADHPGRPDLPDDLADLLLGGVVSLIARYVDRGDTEHLPEATRTLVEYLLIPYLGGEEAAAAAGEPS
ncbi:MAG TPA: TetR/AcrR family transcriptional regulator [Solirubrobacterales bacterium]|nr:TetR/AcrR family transcriptional regulator [Solirubrobacterales bacterium]